MSIKGERIQLYITTGVTAIGTMMGITRITTIVKAEEIEYSLKNLVKLDIIISKKN